MKSKLILSLFFILYAIACGKPAKQKKYTIAKIRQEIAHINNSIVKVVNHNWLLYKTILNRSYIFFDEKNRIRKTFISLPHVDSGSHQIQYFSGQGELIYCVFSFGAVGGGKSFFLGNLYRKNRKVVKLNSYRHYRSAHGEKYNYFKRNILPNNYNSPRKILPNERYISLSPSYHITTKIMLKALGNPSLKKKYKANHKIGGVGQNIWINTYQVSLRDQPSLKSRIIRLVDPFEPGKIVQVGTYQMIEKYGKFRWYKVNLLGEHSQENSARKGKIGWIYGAFLEKRDNYFPDPVTD